MFFAAAAVRFTHGPYVMAGAARYHSLGSISVRFLDRVIAAALLAGWRLKDLADVQLVMVAGYTLMLTFLAPGLWGDLFGGLLKNIPLVALILVHRILGEER